MFSGCGARTALSEEDAGEEGPVETCVYSAENADGGGESPLGALRARYAWLGEVEGCGTTRLYLGEEPALLRDPDGVVRPGGESYLVMALATPEGEGRYETRAVHYVRGEGLDRVGTVTVERYAPPEDSPEEVGRRDGFCGCAVGSPGCAGAIPAGLDGTLEIDVEGWTFLSTFRALHCHALHTRCR